MSYTATVYRILIASPGDLIKERKAAEEVIHAWNRQNSLSKNIVLLPVLWESSSAPDMSNKAQDVLNTQIVDNADLLVGIFWTRIGTKTSNAISATVEEITRHIDNGKLAMLYFSDKPISPSQQDSNQSRLLRKLKDKYRSEGLTRNFKSTSEFGKIFGEHLAYHLNHHDIFNLKSAQESLTEETNFVDLYNEAKMSERAKELLINASLDKNGGIILVLNKEGRTVQTNKKVFPTMPNPQEFAEWGSAVEELVSSNLIAVDKNPNYYYVTSTGYKIAKSLVAKSQD
jgi:hypothetical protein